MKDHDPPRLGDPAAGAPALVREALAAARAAGPTPSQLAGLAARLPLGGPPAPPPPPPPVGLAGTLSGALMGAALGVVVSSAGLLWDAVHETAPPRRAPVAAIAASIVAPRTMPEAPPVTPLRAVPPATTVGSASPSAPRPAPASPSASAGVAPSAAVEPAPVAESGGAAPAQVDMESEVHLLERANKALSASPAEALSLTQEHASRFPSGALGQEREVLAIQALVRLGRGDEARARAARFLAAFPGSAHRRRIEGLLGP